MLQTRFADDLTDNTQHWVDLVLDRIRAEQPDLFVGEESVALAVASTRALLSEFAEALTDDERRERHAPPAALGFARHMARRGLRLASVLRAYRLGNELLLERLASLAGSEQDAASVNRVGLIMLRFADDVSREVADAFDLERESVLRGAIVRRERLVTSLLAGARVRTAEVEQTLGRRMTGRHIALVGWHVRGLEPELIAGAMRSAIEAHCSDAPLVLFGAAGEVHAWATPRDAAPAEAATSKVEAELDSLGVRVALGAPGRGLDGFVASRRQADIARTVAERRPETTVTHYRDVALLALLLRDHAAAQTFAAEELGDLWGSARGGSVLRATLRVHLACHLDATRTARTLQVHRNTVARRLRRAEVLLGHALDHRTLEIAAALSIVDGPQAPS